MFNVNSVGVSVNIRSECVEVSMNWWKVFGDGVVLVVDFECFMYGVVCFLEVELYVYLVLMDGNVLLSLVYVYFVCKLLILLIVFVMVFE